MASHNTLLAAWHVSGVLGSALPIRIIFIGTLDCLMLQLRGYILVINSVTVRYKEIII